MNIENVYLIPHASKPVNEYFNPKLLTRLYPTLFCYGLGAPEDQSRPVQINLKDHIRYLLSYNDRRFETNHSLTPEKYNATGLWMSAGLIVTNILGKPS